MTQIRSTIRFSNRRVRLGRRLRYVWRLVTFRGRMVPCCVCTARYLNVQNPSRCPRCGVIQINKVVRWPLVTDAEIRGAAK